MFGKNKEGNDEALIFILQTMYDVEAKKEIVIGFEVERAAKAVEESILPNAYAVELREAH